MSCNDLRATYGSLSAERDAVLDLAVVLPTYNERDNINEVIARLESALTGLRWEAIFVDDDSPDQTAEVVLASSRRDPRIRLLQRVGRRGLSSACIEGMMATSASCVAVMDADLQHDEKILPLMLARLRAESLDVVVGTRNASGGSMGNFDRSRVWLSRLGERVSHSVSRCQLTDPMSGFFPVAPQLPARSRAYVAGVRLQDPRRPARFKQTTGASG